MSLITKILIIILIVTILWKLGMGSYEHFATTDIFDVRTSDRTLTMVRTMLQDLDGLFNSHGLKYWIDGATLLGAVKHGGIIPRDDDADLCIRFQDIGKLEGLKNWLHNMGYGMVRFWAGYRIFPFSGVDPKYINRSWRPGHYNKDLADREDINYLYPFVDVFVCQERQGRMVFANKHLRRLWGHHWHSIKDLMPLKRYRFNGFSLWGPKNPQPYLKRAYGRDTNSIGYKSHDLANSRYVPLVKPKVAPLVDDYNYMPREFLR